MWKGACDGKGRSGTRGRRDSVDFLEGRLRRPIPSGPGCGGRGSSGGRSDRPGSAKRAGLVPDRSERPSVPTPGLRFRQTQELIFQRRYWRWPRLYSRRFQATDGGPKDPRAALSPASGLRPWRGHGENGHAGSSPAPPTSGEHGQGRRGPTAANLEISSSSVGKRELRR